MSYHNPFSDQNTFSEPPKSNSGAIVLMVLAIIGGVFLLMCGGMFAGGVWLTQQVQQDMQRFEIRPAPDDAGLQRYFSLRDAGRYDEALVELEDALARNPDNALLHNEKAWMLATCPIDEIRDGPAAVEHGTMACELSGWSNPAYVDTLAAAHAEAGDFQAAAERQQEAIDLAPPAWGQPGLQYRLELYQSNQPYREGAVGSAELSGASESDAPSSAAEQATD